MLRIGVEIFELHPVQSQRLLLRPVPGEDTPVRLHSKAGVIDGQQVFIGSVNIDPRSDGLNTEFGVLVDSPALAAQTLRLLQLLQHEAADEVRLKPGTERDLEWRRLNEQQQVDIIDSEPGASLWMRMKLYIQSLLIPESLL
jgi:putative cardiolipin synthase